MITRPKSSMPNRRFSNKLKQLSNNKTKSTGNITFNQSPKISSGKYRSLSGNKSSFSLLDVNDKILNNKGPSLPIQFKRLTSKEKIKLFKEDATETNKNFKKKNASMKNILFHRLNYSNTTKNKKVKNSIEEQKETEKINFETDYKTDILNVKKDKIIFGHNKYFLNNNYITKLKNERNTMQRPQTCRATRRNISFNKISFEMEERKDKEKTEIKRDMWKPLGYEIYEEMVKNRKLFMKKMQENPFFNKIPQFSLKEMKQKVNNSDIFLLVKNAENIDLEKKIISNKIKKSNIYFNSDIFNIKNDDINIKKIGEKYLFKDPKIPKYTSSNESKSDWQNKLTKEALNNCSSKNYNILTPNRKNNFMTKDDIYKTLSEKNVFHNLLHKHNTVSKYIDSANNNLSNSGNEYFKYFNLNPNCFKRFFENCGSFGELYLQYKNLVDEPFHKKNLYEQNNLFNS